MIVLSLFPGAGLCEYGFIKRGDMVVRGPDILWGQDVREFKGQPNIFDVVIGGPPCQMFSVGNAIKKGINLIPEFLRIVDECKPKVAVMENVPLAQRAAPDWPFVNVCDAYIGGKTKRIRRFWFYGIEPPPQMPYNREKYKSSAYAVLASSRKNRSMQKQSLPQYFPEEAANLQGFDGLHEKMMNAWPSRMSKVSKEYLAVHLLGNGWTAAMSDYIAEWIHKNVSTNTFSRSTEIKKIDPREISRTNGLLMEGRAELGIRQN